MRRLLLAMILVGCGRPEKSATSARGGSAVPGEATPVSPEAYATPTPSPNAGTSGATPAPGSSPTGDLATPTPNGGAGLAPSAAGAVVVVAKILDAGPIGDGRCSQRSYQIAIDKAVTGAAPASPLWAHFEQCGDRTSEPAAGNLAGTGLRTGTTYQLTLMAGASKNFGAGFVIVDARMP